MFQKSKGIDYIYIKEPNHETFALIKYYIQRRFVFLLSEMRKLSPCMHVIDTLNYKGPEVSLVVSHRKFKRVIDW